MELLKQKQDLLTKSISETESKQKILSETLKQIDGGKVKVIEAQYRDLQREIVLTDKRLEKATETGDKSRVLFKTSMLRFSLWAIKKK